MSIVVQKLTGEYAYIIPEAVDSFVCDESECELILKQGSIYKGIENGEPVAAVYFGEIGAAQLDIADLPYKKIPPAWKFWKAVERYKAIDYNYALIQDFEADRERGFRFIGGRWFAPAKVTYRGR